MESVLRRYKIAIPYPITGHKNFPEQYKSSILQTRGRGAEGVLRYVFEKTWANEATANVGQKLAYYLFPQLEKTNYI